MTDQHEITSSVSSLPEILTSKIDFELDQVERIEDGINVTYLGYGDTYFRVLPDDTVEDSQFSIKKITGHTQKVDPDDTLTFEFGDEPGLIEVHSQGYVEGGITLDGSAYQRGYHDESGTWLNSVVELMKAQMERDDARGLIRIFLPGTPNFDIEKQIDSTQQQRASYIKGKLLIYGSGAVAETEVDPFGDPHFPVENLARDTADLLRPTYAVALRNKRFLTSSPVRLGRDTRIFTAVYDEDNPQIPTLFYRSNSHGIWRALVATAQTENDRWYAKGMFGAENSVDAPIELQRHFDMAVANAPVHLRLLSEEAVDALTAVPTVHLQQKENHRRQAMSQTRMFAQSVMELAGLSSWGSDRATYDPYDPNHTKLFTDAFKPNFGQPKDRWVTSTALYDEVTATVYPSKNGYVNYLVYEAEFEGRIQRWVATAESARSPMSTLGLPQWWPNLLPEVVSPPIDYEYPQDGSDVKGYGDRRSARTRFDVFAARSIAAYKGIGRSQEGALDAE